MAGGAGYGAGPWGGIPWGGALPVVEVLQPQYCDLFLFEHEPALLDILSDPIIEILGDPTQFVAGYLASYDLGILSGDLTNASFSTEDACITAVPVDGIDNSFTLETTIFQETLPNDFSDIVNRHLAIAITNTNGPCAAIFISKVGFAYAGAFHHNSGNLVLDSTLQVIPDTASKVISGDFVIYRIAVSGTTGAVYFYATRASEIAISGHKLIAVLPTINSDDLVVVPSQDSAVISVRGSTTQPTRCALDRWCLSSQLLVANITPVANAGQDQSIRLCSIAQLDGSTSFDPEGANLLYDWRLIDAPIESEFAAEGSDGATYPDSPPSGFTAYFYSAKLAALHAFDPILAGDVLLVDGEPRTIIDTSVAGEHGFHVIVAEGDLPDNLTTTNFKLLRQRGISNKTSINPTFFPDVAGFYKFDLTVFDGSLYSESSVVVLNVLESLLPRGCTPDTDFVFDYLPDFWNLVEDSDKLATFWSGLAQVASSELYTLWQHEYSKSLRDIQRTIARRWLHYDLLLPEPLPELTRIRAIWSGIESSQVSIIAGAPGLNGTDLVISADIFSEDQTITFESSLYPAEIVAELISKLALIDERFSVSLIYEKTSIPTFAIIRIDAPFPFTVTEETTAPIFTVNNTSGVLEGSGAAIGVNSYVLDRSLQDVDIIEDDLLILDGIGYRIIRTLSGDSNSSDTLPSQRVALKDPLPVPAPTTWKIGSSVTSELLDFYQGMVSAGDEIYFEVDSIENLIHTKTLGTQKSLPSKLSFDAGPIGAALAQGLGARLAKIVRRTYLPINSLVVDIPTLQENIVIEDDEATLRRNMDFFLEEYRGASSIRFLSGNSPDVWEGEAPPDRLWAEYTYIDNNPTIEANFGLAVDFPLDKLTILPESLDYLSAVRGLWYVYTNGPTPFNLRVGAQIFLGLPFAEESGVIEEIRTDFSPSEGRLLIRDTSKQAIVRSYRYPRSLGLEVNPDTSEQYKVGDSVSQFAPLVEGVEVKDYISDPIWYEGLINQGIFQEVQKYHTFLVRVDSKAFALSTLMLIRDFALRMRPQSTYPIFIVTYTANECDIDVTDQLVFHGTLHLNDTICRYNGSPMVDNARPGPIYLGSPGQPYMAPNGAFGQWWNQADADDDPANSAPTYPTSDGPNSPELPYPPSRSAIKWGIDREYLHPEDEITIDKIVIYAAPFTPTADSFLKVDAGTTDFEITVPGISTTNLFEDTGPGFTIPPGINGLVLTINGTDTAPLDGNLVSVRLLLVGSIVADFTDYELVVTINGGAITPIAFEADQVMVEVNAVITGAITATDIIGLKIRIPSGSENQDPRNPGWDKIYGRVVIEDAGWQADMGTTDFGITIPPLPAGNYISADIPLS